MIKRSTLIWMSMAVVAGVGLFTLKHDVSESEELLATLSLETNTHNQEIHILKAEWAYLNRPDRLDKLGRRFLVLEPTLANQTIAIEDIPFRPRPNLGLNPGNTVPPAADRDPPQKLTFLRVP